MTCEVCEIVEKRNPERIIYEDEMSIAFFSVNALTQGHIVVAPKKHYEDVDKIPKDIVSHLFYVASFASTGVYEILGGGNVGTNIVMSEGKFDKKTSHVTIDVVPRTENDSIKFKWEPKPADQNELNSVMEKISGETFVIGKRDESDSERKPVKREPEVFSDENKVERDYLIEKLNRIP